MIVRTVFAALACAALAISGATFASPVNGDAPSLSHLASGIEARNGLAQIEVTALTDSIVRVRIARPPGFGEDSSWAVPAAVRRERVPVIATGDGFRTKTIAVHVDPTTLELRLTDLSGRTLSADLPRPVRFDGHGFTLSKALPIGEHIFGMGDKTGVLDRRGYTFTNWNSDSFGYTPSTDPIYKSIPFFIAVGAGTSYGMFLDNNWRSTFDFGHRDPNAIEISAVDGPIDYYLIAGPTMADVVRRYTDLTGKPPLAPLWSLGYQQSRWSYMSDAEVRTLAARFRQEHFPIDVIWLDIDYQDHNRPFTVNHSTFPDMRRLVTDMGGEGIRLVPITDLHIAYLPNQGYAPFDSGMAGNNFVRKADGSLYVAPVWPGPSVFPDFTRASTRAWWGKSLQELHRRWLCRLLERHE